MWALKCVKDTVSHFSKCNMLEKCTLLCSKSHNRMTWCSTAGLDLLPACRSSLVIVQKDSVDVSPSMQDSRLPPHTPSKHFSGAVSSTFSMTLSLKGLLRIGLPHKSFSGILSHKRYSAGSRDSKSHRSLASPGCSEHPREPGHQGLLKLTLCSGLNSALVEVNVGLKLFEPPGRNWEQVTILFALPLLLL